MAKKYTQAERVERWAERHGLGNLSRKEQASAFYQHRLERAAAKQGTTVAQAKQAGGLGSLRGQHSYGEHGIGRTVVGQSLVYSTRDPGRVEQILNRVERNDEGNRAAVHWRDRDGEWHSVFAKGGKHGGKGYSVDAMARAVRSGSLAQFVADATNSPELEELLDDAAEIQIEVY